jgi:hypothetical protein
LSSPTRAEARARYRSADAKQCADTERVNGKAPTPDLENALTDTDYANLERRWIDRSLAYVARIRRVDSGAGRLIVGRRDHASYEGLAIPYVLPGESHVREWRLRRDNPEIEYVDGKQRERSKYLSPPGRRNMLYFVPGLSPELLKCQDTAVIVTEGEFKTLALWRLANHEATAPRFLPIGLAGVWNWRGTVGKTTGPNGDRRDVKGVIPDLRCGWEQERGGCHSQKPLCSRAADARGRSRLSHLGHCPRKRN